MLLSGPPGATALSTRASPLPAAVSAAGPYLAKQIPLPPTLAAVVSVGNQLLLHGGSDVHPGARFPQRRTDRPQALDTPPRPRPADRNSSADCQPRAPRPALPNRRPGGRGTVDSTARDPNTIPAPGKLCGSAGVTRPRVRAAPPACHLDDLRMRPRRRPWSCRPPFVWLAGRRCLLMAYPR